MYTIFLSSFILMFCVEVKVISAEESNENDTIKTQIETLDFMSADIAEVEYLHIYASKSEASRANECDCGFGGDCEFDFYGRKNCNCRDGFFERGEYCWPCRCMQYSDEFTKCEVTGTKKRCFCQEGFQDVLGHCEDIDECEVNNTCHPEVICYNTKGSFECECPEGYRGANGRIVKPGEICEDINECQQKKDACSFGRFVKCVNLPGSYKCECQPRYEPYTYRVQPHQTSCRETTKSWGPATIVIFTTAALILVLIIMHSHLKKRAARSS